MPDRYGEDNWDDAPKVGPNGCPEGGACDGFGWITVQPAYAERAFPMPDDPPMDATDEEVAAYEARVRATQIKRAAAEGAVYPCRACRAGPFYRWAKGHYDRNHDADACAECLEMRGRRRTNA